MNLKFQFAWKLFRIFLGVICTISIVLWGGNWIIAGQYLNSPEPSSLNMFLITGMWAGLLFGSNWRWRGLGIIIGLAITYLYIYIAVAINHLNFLPS